MLNRRCVLTGSLAILLLVGCGVRQNLKRSLNLEPGMTKTEVLGIMGEPVKAEFAYEVDEWHYCSTGMQADQFLALFFHEGALVASKSYSVTLADTEGVTGSCENFIKKGNYREPDQVVEIRSGVK